MVEILAQALVHTSHPGSRLSHLLTTDRQALRNLLRNTFWKNTGPDRVLGSLLNLAHFQTRQFEPKHFSASTLPVIRVFSLLSAKCQVTVVLIQSQAPPYFSSHPLPSRLRIKLPLSSQSASIPCPWFLTWPCSSVPNWVEGPQRPSLNHVKRKQETRSCTRRKGL